MKDQDIRITKLEKDNEILKIENNTLKNEMQQLNKKVDVFMRNQYIITLAEAIKNIQYYIIQTATKYTNLQMEKITININEFLALPENEIYKKEIDSLIVKFEFSKYKDIISKVINKRNKLSYPDPVELDILELACNTMKATYPGLDALYKHYQIIYDYFN